MNILCFYKIYYMNKCYFTIYDMNICYHVIYDMNICYYVICDKYYMWLMCYILTRIDVNCKVVLIEAILLLFIK